MSLPAEPIRATAGNKKPDFHIGPIPIYGQLALAPMDGLSDQPFRSLCREMGAAFSVSEFINIQDVAQGRNHLARRIAFSPAERPLGYQLYGREVGAFLTAAQMLMKRNPDFMDVNLGCSTRGIATAGSGAGLLRQPELVREIFSLLTAHLTVPVSAKIRLGWDTESRNHLEICQLLEDNGAAMIAVHARTAVQGWSQPADWAAIAEIKRRAGVPIIGNGDVRTIQDTRRMFTQTGCDGIMIGRGAIGNPWLFAGVEKSKLPLTEILAVIQRHWDKMASFYGQELAERLFRKHLKAYLSDLGLWDTQMVREVILSSRPMERLVEQASAYLR